MIGGRLPREHEVDFMGRFGSCSAVVVGERSMLTSAHCVHSTLSTLETPAGVFGVAKCVPHPEYVDGEAEHDLAFCSLQATAEAPRANIETKAIAKGTAVTLAGYGQRGPFEKSDGLQVVDTEVVGVVAGHLLAGTSDATACRGDSGGAALSRSAEGTVVIGIVHGTSGAICASPAELTSLASNAKWLREVGALGDERVYPPAMMILAVPAVVLAAIWVRRRKDRVSTPAPTASSSTRKERSERNAARETL